MHLPDDGQVHGDDVLDLARAIVSAPSSAEAASKMIGGNAWPRKVTHQKMLGKVTGMTPLPDDEAEAESSSDYSSPGIVVEAVIRIHHVTKKYARVNPETGVFYCDEDSCAVMEDID